DFSLFSWIIQIRVAVRSEKRPNAGCQGVSTPVTDPADDEIIGRNPASDGTAIWNIAANGLPGNLSHADFISAIANADCDKRWFLPRGRRKEKVRGAH